VYRRPDFQKGKNLDFTVRLGIMFIQIYKKKVKSFNIEKDTTLLTDHAMLTTVLGNFECNPNDLLSYVIKMNKSLGNPPEKTPTKYPLKMNNINLLKTFLEYSAHHKFIVG